MPFPISVSEPFCYPSELRRLVDAVRMAGDYDENRWIEWKSTLDLTSKNGMQHIAKQILGFANRDAAVAGAWARGYAQIFHACLPIRFAREACRQRGRPHQITVLCMAGL